MTWFKCSQFASNAGLQPWFRGLFYLEGSNTPIVVNVPIDDEDDSPTVENMNLDMYFEGHTPSITTVEKFPIGFPIPLKFTFHLLYIHPVRYISIFISQSMTIEYRMSQVSSLSQVSSFRSISRLCGSQADDLFGLGRYLYWKASPAKRGKFVQSLQQIDLWLNALYYCTFNIFTKLCPMPIYLPFFKHTASRITLGRDDTFLY